MCAPSALPPACYKIDSSNARDNAARTCHQPGMLISQPSSISPREPLRVPRFETDASQIRFLPTRMSRSSGCHISTSIPSPTVSVRKHFIGQYKPRERYVPLPARLIRGPPASKMRTLILGAPLPAIVPSPYPTRAAVFVLGSAHL